MDETSHTRRRSLQCWSPYTIFAIFHMIVHARTTLAFTLVSHVSCHQCSDCHFSKNADGEEFRITDDSDDDGQNTSSPSDSDSNLDMKAFQLRKNKIMLQSHQQRWYQPPNPLLEDPIEFVQAILVALQERKKNGASNGALCLLRSSTPSWRRILLKSVGAPLDASNDQVGPSLQNALERSNNQFAILTMKLDEDASENSDFTTTIRSIQKCWDFPTDPVIFEEDGDENDREERKEEERIIDRCWIESRLRSPKDDELLTVVGWSLQRRQIVQKGWDNRSSYCSNNTYTLSACWLLDGIDWQDFRDEFRPGIGREEWERICG